MDEFMDVWDNYLPVKASIVIIKMDTSPADISNPEEVILIHPD